MPRCLWLPVLSSFLTVLLRLVSTLDEGFSCQPEDVAASTRLGVACSLQLVPTDISTLLLDKNPYITAIQPSIVALQKCIGSCPIFKRENACLATQTRNRSIPVMVFEAIRDDQPVPLCTKVQVVEDERCDCACHLAKDNCQPDIQQYSSADCKCVCTDKNAKYACLAGNLLEKSGYPKKVWHEASCSCKCSIPFKECSTGYVYDDTDTCGCVPDNSVRLGSHVPVGILSVLLCVCLAILVFLAYKVKTLNNRIHRSRHEQPKLQLLPLASP